ncbi:uracil phosphoribosyltransferase [Candidatus Kaiserbacteria bacterium]|nr:uracil phosphoribosyltransferase [Candidatus Kaiserbacteria bacterium]
MPSEINASLQTLRDRGSTTAEFRNAVGRVCEHLLRRTKDTLRHKNTGDEDLVFAIILRAALAFLPSVNRVFPGAPIAVLGMKRDEKTLAPRWYYENLPPLTRNSSVIILDPMLATGGSAASAAKKLIERGADPKRMYFCGIVAAPEGILRLSRCIPEDHILLASIDRGLDTFGMITPGLGDFGDRYFGYEGRAVIG